MSNTIDHRTLEEQIQKKSSFLCVGLDTDIEKIPKEFLKLDDPIFEFNKQIIDVTADLAVAYKLNTAFYEALFIEGWQAMQKTVNYIKESYPNILVIADAKRGDIGNTCNEYAKAFFEKNAFDAITLAPYMGRDSIDPFMQYEGKWAIVLGLTSNESSQDFETLELKNGHRLYDVVTRFMTSVYDKDRLMIVVGATQSEHLEKLRETSPNHFFLVPGVGAQGGSLEEVFHKARIKNGVGLLVNSSRQIIYSTSDYIALKQKVRETAQGIQREMQQLLDA